MKKISVIIPCYNVASYIDKCLISVTAQTMGIDALEIICIDDASTDDTWLYLQRWEKMFPNDIILLRQPVNRRQGAARNLGLLYASADWVAFVDADDWLEFDYFQKLYSPLEQFRCDVVSCGTMRDIESLDNCFNKSNRKPGNEYYLLANTKELKATALKRKLLGIGPAAKIIRKKLLVESNILFPEDLAYEDHYWIPLLHLYADGLYMIEERLYHYYWNPHSTSLAKNKDYHADFFTVQLLKWMDYRKAGLLDEYKEALEEDFLWYIMPGLSIIMGDLGEQAYSYFQLEQKTLQCQMPDYKRIVERCAGSFSEKHQMLLQALCFSADRKEFEQLVRVFRE